MIIWIILGIGAAAVAFGFKYMRNKIVEIEEEYSISGIVLEKRSGKPAENVEVLLGNMTVNRSDNDFIPIKGKSVLTGKDGKFKFTIDKKGVLWVMGRKNGKKVLKPLNTEFGNIDDILLTV